MLKLCKKLGVFWENMSNHVTTGPEKTANQTIQTNADHSASSKALLKPYCSKSQEEAELRAAQIGMLSPHILFVLKFFITALASCMESVVTGTDE